MGLNVTNVYITTALESLRYALITRLTDEQAEQLCDELIKLCGTYAPDTFSKIADGTENFPPIGLEDLFEDRGQGSPDTISFPNI